MRCEIDDFVKSFSLFLQGAASRELNIPRSGLLGAMFSGEKNAPRSFLLTGVRRSMEETPKGPTLLGDYSLEPISTGIVDLLRPTSMKNTGPWRLSHPVFHYTQPPIVPDSTAPASMILGSLALFCHYDDC